MEPIALRCSYCGGELEFDASMVFGFCKYCGTKNMIPKSVPETVYNIIPDTTRFFLLIYQSGEQTQYSVKDEVTIKIQYRNNASGSDLKPLGASICSSGLTIPNNIKLSTNVGLGIIQITGLGKNLTITREQKINLKINGLEMKSTISKICYGDLISIGNMILRIQPIPME